MTRQERAIKNSQKIAQHTKEKGEKVTILKIVEIAKVSKNSASKYLKKAREEGII